MLQVEAKEKQGFRLAIFSHCSKWQCLLSLNPVLATCFTNVRKEYRLCRY